MGWYRDKVLPRLVDCACGTADLRSWRERATDGLNGSVLEIGFGSGLNLALYPDSVTEVIAVEPSDLAIRLAERRATETTPAIRRVGVDAGRLPLDDASCDAAVSTFTLCTVPDVEAALAEVYRVLRPGAPFHFVEHGLSPDARVARWQRRLDPLQQRVAGGCHLTRLPRTLVADAGFDVVWAHSRYARGPRPWSWLTEGRAVRPAS